MKKYYENMCQCNNQNKKLKNSQFLFHSILLCPFHNIFEIDLQLFILKNYCEECNNFDKISRITNIGKISDNKKYTS